MQLQGGREWCQSSREPSLWDECDCCQGQNYLQNSFYCWGEPFPLRLPPKSCCRNELINALLTRWFMSKAGNFHICYSRLYWSCSCARGLYGRCLRSALIFLLRSVMCVAGSVSSFWPWVVRAEVRSIPCRGLFRHLAWDTPVLCGSRGAAVASPRHGASGTSAAASAEPVTSPGPCSSHGCVARVISVGEGASEEVERRWRKWRRSGGELVEYMSLFTPCGRGSPFNRDMRSAINRAFVLHPHGMGLIFSAAGLNFVL